MSTLSAGVVGPWERSLAAARIPVRVYFQYLLKFTLYVSVWGLCCALSEKSVPDAAWYLQPDAFKKFVLWSLLFEGLGLGCSSGPLSGAAPRWFTPYRYFLTRGAVKVPFIEGLPIFGSHRRSWLDVALFVTNALLLVRALVAPQVLPVEHVLPIVVVSLLMGLSDRTQFLCMRPEQYLYLAICFLFPNDWIAGSKWVQFAIWMGAGISKLNQIFPYVTLVLAVTHPLLGRLPGVPRAMVRSTTDLRPSPLCERLTYVGTAVEISFPILLMVSDGGWPTLIGLLVMTGFHLNIITSMPRAVPIEWNIFVLYSMWFLFGHHAAAPLSISSPILGTFLLVTLLGLPLLGNLRPGLVSFLISMRYYAGNWAYSSWLFRGREVHEKLGQIEIARAPFNLGLAPVPRMPYFGKRPNSGSLHLLGRGLQLLWPKAVGGIEHLPEYIPVFGDGVARRLLGWSFGDGHLHDERLLRVVQAHCQFKPGELIHIFVESQPLHRQSVEYRITDAATGLVERGEIPISVLKTLQLEA